MNSSKINRNNHHNPFQKTLFKGAKACDIHIMEAAIAAGADPYLCDENGCNAISYALHAFSEKTESLMQLLKKVLLKESSNNERGQQ
jgi:hypothetical protein